MKDNKPATGNACKKLEKAFPLRNTLENFNRALRLIRIMNFNPKKLMGPLSVEISLTSACNFNCYFCSSHALIGEKRPASQHLSDSVIFKLLEDIRMLGTSEILFSGDGEPFLHSRFREIIDACKGHKVKIATNGSKLDLVSADLFSKIHKLTISLNSVDDETHRLIHGYKGLSRLPFVIENIERLLRMPRARQKLQINCAVGVYNLEELETLFQLSNRWNVFFAVRPVNPVFPEIEPKTLTQAQMQDAREKIAKMLRKTALSPNAVASLKYALFCFQSDRPYSPRKRPLPCYVGFYGAYLASSGDYQICCHCKSAMGNINLTRFANLWKDRHVQETIYAASLMQQNNIDICPECVSCSDVQMYSRIFHAVFSNIPYQTALLKSQYERYKNERSKKDALNDR